jgi:hypothetical protein
MDENVARSRGRGSIPTVQLATKISPAAKSRLEAISAKDQVTFRKFIEDSIDQRYAQLQTGATGNV